MTFHSPKARFPAVLGRPTFLFVAMLFVVSLGAAHAHAQPIPAQYKTQSISVFAGYLRDSIDFFPKAGNGVAFGLDFTRHIHFPVQPSLEGRVNLANSNLANEKSYAGGLRGDYRIGRFYPYADFLLGFGTIHFNPGAGISYAGDNSTVYEPGIGVEYDVSHSFRAKVDFQHQYWNIGHTASTEFQPNLLTLGVAYAVPFRPFHRHGEPHY